MIQSLGNLVIYWKTEEIDSPKKTKVKPLFILPFNPPLCYNKRGLDIMSEELRGN